MYKIELNNLRMDTSTRFKQQSPAVEIFSDLVTGVDEGKHGKNKDAVMSHTKELAQRAERGDYLAKSELNSLIRFAMQPALQSRIDLFNFMGKFQKLAYHEHPMVVEYKHNTRSNHQAAQGDVALSTMEKHEYPVGTHTISGGFAVNYREVASGNLTNIAEGMDQVKISIHNKAMHYVIATMYAKIKQATGVKYFAEVDGGLTKQALDDVLTKVRRNGKPGIIGDYSIVSQINQLQGFAPNAPQGVSQQALEEIRQSGLLGVYGGSTVIEIPNEYDRQNLNKEGDNYKTVLPEGLLYVVPQGNGNGYPLQIFQRGDLMSATGFDVVTGTELTRFDLEIGAELVKPDAIGLISDTRFEAPEL